jgi:organic hydroperoxide reductase OsmC/OhrA
MSEHTATIVWQRDNSAAFTDNKYSRAHQWLFDGGAVISASPSPHIVATPYSVEENVDPEEAFIASLSSCHMLFFLQIAANKKIIVDSYLDQAIGLMGKGDSGKICMTKVILRPEVKFSGEQQPSLQLLESMHHQAHEQCFIANSVKTEVLTEIVI